MANSDLFQSDDAGDATDIGNITDIGDFRFLFQTVGLTSGSGTAPR